MILAILLFAAQIVVDPIPVGTTVIPSQPITGSLSFAPQSVASDKTGKINTYGFTTVVDRSTLSAGNQIFITIENSPDGIVWAFLCGAVITQPGVSPGAFTCPINAKINQQVRGTITIKANTNQKTNDQPDPAKELDATVTTTASIAVQ